MNDMYILMGAPGGQMEGVARQALQLVPILKTDNPPELRLEGPVVSRPGRHEGKNLCIKRERRGCDTPQYPKMHLMFHPGQQSCIAPSALFITAYVDSRPDGLAYLLPALRASQDVSTPGCSPQQNTHVIHAQILTNYLAHVKTFHPRSKGVLLSMTLRLDKRRLGLTG